MLFRTTNTILTALLVATLARAQEEHHHEEAATASSLDTVSVPMSCSAEGQTDFNHGMALLHSFSYKNARLTLQQINEAIPHAPTPYHWAD